jgi:hypothetical protein
MLAWVCWDEFVNLESPYTVRWMEKCNEAHIAAMRIITRDTLSQAVASREHDIQAGSPETGHLMSSLLMVAMSKLAAMRTTAPVVVDKAEDTVTKLMRGLFGNLLTIAGSGVRPLSMVWQLFGLNSQNDLPNTDADWFWYETVVDLYPYTGWPRERFYENLEKLLDKAIVRVVTKGENLAEVKQNRIADMIKYCKLRNIQLDHSRTIITIFMRMLTEENTDIEAVAKRLLEQLPRKLERQEKSYTKMISYLEHLATGGERRQADDINAANVYTRRSAAFAELKSQVAEACRSNDWPAMKEACQAMLDKHTETAALWNINYESLMVQNEKLYKNLLSADFSDDLSPGAKFKNLELTRQALGDAEISRVPWQVGKKGQFGSNIEPLDEAFLHEIMIGETLESLPVITSGGEVVLTETTSLMECTMEDDFSQYEASLQGGFIRDMQKDLTAEEVCGMLKVPVSTMRIFIKSLNPEYDWNSLGPNFKVVILGLLKDRMNRMESRPAKKLLELKTERMLQIEGST